MKLYLDEEKQGHLYRCLLVGGKEWAKMKKGREKLELSTEEEDRELEINAKLRMELNPKAEEIARARERKDPAQQDFTAGEGLPSSGETGGGHPAGETFKTKLRLNGEDVVPTDADLRDALLTHDRCVLLSDIAEWSPGDRMNVILWVTAHQNWLEADEKGPEPEEPECLAFVALSETRMVTLVDAGPYEEMDNVEEVEGQEETELRSVTVRIPAKGEEGAADYKPEVVFGEYEDEVDAQIKVARLNQAFQRTSDMSEEDVSRWLGTGPWTTLGREQDGEDVTKTVLWFVVLTAFSDSPDVNQQERVQDEGTARATAARYNRTIAGDGAKPVESGVEE